MSDLVGEGVYDQVEVARTRSLAAAFSEAVVSTSDRPPTAVRLTAPAPDPFDLLIAMSLGQADAAAATMRPSFGAL